MNRRSETTSEVLRRADHALGKKFLVVDYYRIRRRFAFPLGMNEMILPDATVPGIPVYPWATWLSWTLEERILSLGWAAQWTNDEKYSTAATRDLEALASWPRFRQYETPDLCLAHLSRILWTARTRWNWLSAKAQTKIDAALARLVADALPLHRAHFGEKFSLQSLLARKDAHRVAHNIALIGSLGIALAAHALGDDDASGVLQADLAVLQAALLALRENGFSEGVCYDGHVLDFLADWLQTLPKKEREETFCDARWASFFHESLHLGAPGKAAQIAPLSDVESQSSFHISAQAKFHLLQREKPLLEYSRREWYLRQLNLSALRVDGLAALRELPELPESEISEPPSGVGDAHYALTLRSGWEHEDVAVAVAASNSPMNHISANYGSLCIGSAGNWLIQTPGYQQYIPGSEREFTIGKTSRNTPLINGFDASIKAGKVIKSATNQSSSQIELELTHCYKSELGLKSLSRRVELTRFDERDCVLVEDRIAPGDWENIVYYWHGHPDAAWRVEENWAMIHLPCRTIWFTSPQAKIYFSNVERLRGSRGQLTLVAPITRGDSSVDALVVQWLFVFGDERPVSALENFGLEYSRTQFI